MRILHNSVPFEIFLQKLPLSICDLTLGLGALGNLMLAYSKMFHWIYISMAAILWLLLVLKLIFCWPQAQQELKNPLNFSVFEAFFMTLLQISAAIAPYFYQSAFTLWLVANIGHAIIVLLFSWYYLRNFQLQNVFATWNVLYGGNMLSAVVSVSFQMQHVGQWILWIGFFLFFPWYFVAAYRYYKLPVTDAALPTVCIFSAPFNLALAAYLSCTAQPSFTIALLFAAIGQSAYIFVLCCLPRILRLPFYSSYGALTFPFVIPAVALEKLLHTLNTAGTQQLAFWNIIVRIEESISIIMVTYALLRYLYFLWGIAQSTRKETVRPPGL